MNYLTKHWRGEHSLATSLWINLVSLMLLLEYSQGFIYGLNIQQPNLLGGLVVLFVLISKLIIYPWQAIGLLRCCEFHIQSNRARPWASLSQIILVLSLAAILLSSLGSYQLFQGFKQEQLRQARVKPEPLYSLSLIELEVTHEHKEGQLIHLSGPFEIGITNSLDQLIKQNSDNQGVVNIRGIILDSEGGQVYEGRGLAKLIRENQLDTFTLTGCFSSCTTAFVAGKFRSLGSGAKLGFHQYKTYSQIPSVNVAHEQARDLKIFSAQGVSEQFLGKLFQMPADQMWWPSTDELIEAGLIHARDWHLEHDRNSKSQDK